MIGSVFLTVGEPPQFAPTLLTNVVTLVFDTKYDRKRLSRHSLSFFVGSPPTTLLVSDDLHLPCTSQKPCGLVRKEALYVMQCLGGAGRTRTFVFVGQSHMPYFLATALYRKG